MDARLNFFRYLDDLEGEWAMELELVGKPYNFIIDEKYHWSKWAAPEILLKESLGWISWGV